MLERFFDESGGMQLVLHAPFGSRINKAWGLALRKRFCRQFNFELQAAATEDALLLSLGPQHSFPLADVFRYLHPETTRDVLVQAFLDAPVFQTRWRWNTTISLAVPRNRGGRKVAPQLQRMLADDLMAAVFPDAAACLENIPGDRADPRSSARQPDGARLPRGGDGLRRPRAVLDRIHRGELRLVARDTPEPSVFAHEILNARPYAFPRRCAARGAAERRRCRRRAATAAVVAGDLGALDADAIDACATRSAPDPRDADELHDALLTAGFLTRRRSTGVAAADDPRRRGARRAPAGSASRRAIGGRAGSWIAAERLPELRASIRTRASIAARTAAAGARARVDARRRDRRAAARPRRMAGPTTAPALARVDRHRRRDADRRGAARARSRRASCCARASRPGGDRRDRVVRPHAARAHPSLHAEPAARRDRAGQPGRLHAVPVRVAARRSARADRDRRPARRHRAARRLRAAGARVGARRAAGAARGLRAVDARHAVPHRRVGWARLSPRTSTDGEPPRLARDADRARSCASTARRTLAPAPGDADAAPQRPSGGARVLDVLPARGASFFGDLAAACGLDADRIAARARHAGRAAASRPRMASPACARSCRCAPGATAARDRRVAFRRTMDALDAGPPGAARRDAAVEAQAWALLRRYGVVFRRLLDRETNAAPWRELARVYRRLEARGEIRGGRFVTGMSGEQFALPRAVERLREVRRASRRTLCRQSAPPIRSTSPPSSPRAIGCAPRRATASSIATASRLRHSRAT